MIDYYSKSSYNKAFKVVYVILNEETNRVKIGITGNVEDRLANIISQAGCCMKLSYTTPRLKYAKELEQSAHRYFDKKRYLGEWFDISPFEAINFLEKNTQHFGETCEFKDYQQDDERQMPTCICAQQETKLQKEGKKEVEEKKEKEKIIQKEEKNYSAEEEEIETAQIVVDEYEEHVLDEPLTRYKRIGKNVFVRKKDGVVFNIRYINKQWIARKLNESELMESVPQLQRKAEDFLR